MSANEEIVDELSARVEDLERRLEALTLLLRRDAVRRPLGLADYDLSPIAPSGSPLDIRAMKHTHARDLAVRDLQREDVLAKLSGLPPGRLDAILQGPR